MGGARLGASGTERHGRTMIQPGDDRAMRPTAAVAGIDQDSESRDDLLKRVELCLQGPEMLSRNRLYLGIAAAGVAPQFQEGADPVQRKAEVSRPLDEAQPVDVSIVVVSVTARPPWSRRQQPDRFIVPDHLGGDSGRPRSVTDVHDCIALLLTFPRWEGAHGGSIERWR